MSSFEFDSFCSRRTSFRVRLAIPAGLCLALIGAGCGSNSTPAPAPPPASSNIPVAVFPPPADPKRSVEKGEPERPADEFPLRKIAEVPAGRYSGDNEPPGRSATFVILKDPRKAGSDWAADVSNPGGVGDVFAAIIPPDTVDSSRYAVSTALLGTGDQPTISVDAASLLKGYVPEPGWGNGPNGLPLRVRSEQDGSLMALVPAGGFVQGKNGASPQFGPQHGVFLDTFYIDVYEVTFEKYEKYRDSSRAAKKLIAEPVRKPTDRGEPVTGVNWGDAKGYATWAGRDLPTEAEWEKAARGVEGFDFPWGNGTPLWHQTRVPGQLNRGGTFAGDMSPFGAFDLAGNAREWCADFYQEKYYTQLVRESGESAHNPAGPRASSGGNERVVKGGDPGWHVWARTGVIMTERLPDVGFRCVLRVKGLDPSPKAPDKKR